MAEAGQRRAAPAARRRRVGVLGARAVLPRRAPRRGRRSPLRVPRRRRERAGGAAAGRASVTSPAPTSSRASSPRWSSGTTCCRCACRRPQHRRWSRPRCCTRSGSLHRRQRGSDARSRYGQGLVAPACIGMGCSSGERLRCPYPAFLSPYPRVVGEHGAGTQRFAAALPAEARLPTHARAGRRGGRRRRTAPVRGAAAPGPAVCTTTSGSRSAACS